MIRSPAIWIITAMVVGFTVWLLWTSSPAPLETASDRTGTEQGDRDSAAEEVPAQSPLRLLKSAIKSRTSRSGNPGDGSNSAGY